MDIARFVLFWVVLLGSFVITFKVLVEIDIAKYYKNKRPVVVYTSYVIISLVCAGILTGLIQMILDLSI